ncbi:MAG: 2-amino-4-hydroxy-6-hydroxymethyldihydropteridine diphosphokinase [Bacteroidota bacterium]|nr:2-amino-4-hydroxy-6-hydroxymethyldihydropteridine diphosphokinase [Bacteroidota bacterium]MDP4205139.1 2-amino-4-hydroxy-6-hydroxymethyldihydropteridine diphosphokinase [Bacteroidota bacterium]
MTKSYLILGGNQGNKENYRLCAIDEIRNRCGELISLSQVYLTEPWGFECDDLFWNQAVCIETQLSPESLLEELLDIEHRLGRIRDKAGYQSRTIDIDILYYDDEIITTDKLIIPHPKIHLRRFVLCPLCDIAPDYIHPVFGKSNLQLLNECPDKNKAFLQEKDE